MQVNARGFPGSSADKESICNEGDLGSIPGLGRSPGGGHYNLLQFSCLENPHGQRSFEGYRPWGHKQSNMSETLSTAQEMEKRGEKERLDNVHSIVIDGVILN